MAKTKKNKTSTPALDLKNLESQMEPFFTKTFPALPNNAVEILVKLAPWLAIVGVVMSLPAIMSLSGMSRVANYYRLAGIELGWGYQLSNLLYVVQLILMALSIQGLFARKMTAWKLMFYSAWISVLASLLTGSLISMLIGGLISFYLLFQVKKAYK